MRLTGAALLTAAGVLAGLLCEGELRARAARLESLCRMLERMAFELGRFCTPLPALFDRLAGQLDGEAAALCGRVRRGLEQLGERDMAGIWTGALAPLPAGERRLLLPLGQVLGRYGAEQQLQAIESCRADLERLRDEARTACREKGRVYVGVSAAGAAALAVLLL